jgi:MacB-like periplasmic core domain
METLIKDFRYGARTLAKKPGFTLVAMFTLALGIGANTAIFSVINAVLLRPLPFPAADRLIVMAEKDRNSNRMGAAYPNYQDWKARSESFEAMAGFRSQTFNLTGVDKTARLQARTVNWNFFQVLGVQPELGRGKNGLAATLRSLGSKSDWMATCSPCWVYFRPILSCFGEWMFTCRLDYF